jgi:DNA-binding MarR family transcriptional regulator
MIGRRWLEDDPGQLWLAYLGASRSLDRVVEQRLRGVGLTHSEFEVLARLTMAPGQKLRMGALASLLVAPKTQLNYQIGRLEERGLVRRLPDADDARGLHACLTPAGAELFRRAAEVQVATVQECLINPLTEDQRHELLAILTAIADATGPLR